jgi:hypothetical protein
MALRDKEFWWDRAGKEEEQLGASVSWNVWIPRDNINMLLFNQESLNNVGPLREV